jgi:hypothetical protein
MSPSVVPERRSGSIARRNARSRGRDDEQRLTADIIELARQYGRYGYRKIAELLRPYPNQLRRCFRARSYQRACSRASWTC